MTNADLQMLCEMAEESGVTTLRLPTALVQQLLFQVTRHEEMRRGAERQCENMRKRWLEVCRDAAKLEKELNELEAALDEPNKFIGCP